MYYAWDILKFILKLDCIMILQLAVYHVNIDNPNVCPYVK